MSDPGPGVWQQRWRTIRVLVLLVGLAYLGFYIYGAVLGVFDPIDAIGFTIVAGVIVLGVVAISLHWRSESTDPEWKADITQQENLQRERRGF